MTATTLQRKRPMDSLVNGTTTQKLVITSGLLAGVIAARLVLVWIASRIDPHHRNGRTVYWTRQITKLATVVVSLALIVRIWVESPAKLASILSFATAGLAFALQRVITAFAGYLLVLKSRTFTVGDRITMAGVRGDVIELGFLRTCIMEMGGPRESQ